MAEKTPNRPVKPYAGGGEAPARLVLHSPVASLDGRRHGKVVGAIRAGLFRVEWSDTGEATVEPRADLLSRFTTQTRAFAGKAA
jgi:hypothetical protein